MTQKHILKQALTSILVAGCSPLDQQCIGRALKALLPTLRIACVSTTQLTTDHLDTTYAELFDIPSLLLLDTELIKSPADWQWLGKLTISYSLLIVVGLSPQGSSQPVVAFYQQGVHAVLTKPEPEASWSGWAFEFMQYWSEAASMPRIQF